jgi:HD-like signal output (HDOD) protein/signal transduction histidine kinase
MQIEEPRFLDISALKNLPTLPHILLKLMEACNKEDTDLKELSLIIDKDPSLTGKILKLVNSAFYGLPYEVESIERAAALVGIKAIKNIAICASICEAFDHNGNHGAFNLKLFWWHSLKCAVLSRLIAKRVEYSLSDEAFLSGLLHDIGKLVLLVNFPQKYPDLLRTHDQRHDLVLEGERRLCGSHCEVGGWILHRWRLPSFMVDSVLYHHEGKSRISEALSLVQIVYVANVLSQEPAWVQTVIPKIPEEIFEFSEADTEELLSQSEEELKEITQSLDIDIEPPKGPKDSVSEKDRKKKIELIRETKDISLLLGTLQSLFGADGQQGILEAVQQGLDILFDARNVLFFLYDPEKEGLIGKTVTEDERVSELRDIYIPLRVGGGLITSSLRSGKPLDSFSQPSNSPPIILDEQIIRFTGREGMVCLPMHFQREPVGVIVVGLDPVEFSHLSKQLKLLSMFANQTAAALHLDNLRQNRLKAIRTERLSASSELSRRVIHEVNSPLSIIKNYLRILNLKLGEHGIGRDEIRVIDEEIDRVTNLLQQLATFSDESARKNEAVDINALLSDLNRTMRESLLKDSRIQLHLGLAPSIPLAMASKDGLKQVFINLIHNAAEAMPEGGNLRIRTRHISSPVGERFPDYGEGHPGYLEIAVSDDGIGIAEELKTRLFEPFVSSKGGKHAGLGLSIVHNIIKSFEGSITCESGRERGTTFKIELPAAKAQHV